MMSSNFVTLIVYMPTVSSDTLHELNVSILVMQMCKHLQEWLFITVPFR